MYIEQSPLVFYYNHVYLLCKVRTKLDELCTHSVYETDSSIFGMKILVGHFGILSVYLGSVWIEFILVAIQNIP